MRNPLLYFAELRRRVLHVSVFFLACFLLCFYQSEALFSALMAPLNRVLSGQDALIATQVTASVLTPIRLALHAACLLTAPLALFHGWRFVSPGLYQQERQGLRGIIIGSWVFFCIGVLFCFYGVLPFMLKLFAYVRPKGVLFMPDMTHTVDFILHLLLLFGLCFQLPWVCVVLVRMNLLTVSRLKIMRPYVIVIAFVVGMLLTPPDVLSQLMLAVPLCLLYEGGIVMAGWMNPRS